MSSGEDGLWKYVDIATSFPFHAAEWALGKGADFADKLDPLEG